MPRGAGLQRDAALLTQSHQPADQLSPQRLPETDPLPKIP